MRRGRHRDHARVERADHLTRTLLVFSLARGCCWLLLILCVGLGLAGVSWLRWAASLGGLVVFITIISLYANAEGEFSQAAGYWAALRAGRAHAQGLRNEGLASDDYAEVLERIEGLARATNSLAELVHEHQLRSEK